MEEDDEEEVELCRVCGWPAVEGDDLCELCDDE